MENTELSQTIEALIRSGEEGLTHDLKWDVDVSKQKKQDQAEFIRDMMSLANADPDNPGERYLIMNAKKGKVNSSAPALQVDDATYQEPASGVREYYEPNRYLRRTHR